MTTPSGSALALTVIGPDDTTLKFIPRAREVKAELERAAHWDTLFD